MTNAVTQRTNGALVVPRVLLGREITRLSHKLMEMFLYKERKKQPKKSHSHILTAWERPQTIWRTES